MHNKKKIRDYGIEIGEMKKGRLNAITDVEGVKVGHVTLSEGDMQTGVTAILPHSGNVFKEKLVASSHVINGFGKSMGTVQLAELGTIETPIILTNTLSTGVAADTLIDYMLEQNPEIGRTTGTVNSVIGECNDMIINDIRGKYVKPEHIREALINCHEVFEEGAVGAGTGMLCYSLKGGIGSASRIMDFEFGSYTLGVLVLTNFGILKDFMIQGNPVGQQLKQKLDEVYKEEDKGSIMTIVATDLPVSERQLQRILKRTVTGLSRTGSIITTGSGEVVIGFSTATKIPHDEKTKLIAIPQIPEEVIDVAFRAVGEATEEAVLNSMITAHEIVGRDGNSRPALKDLLEKCNISLL
ncbi:aminopeptidase [Kurthia zopfii]|uniref:D-aminopeptidase n=1 Tax=Kurthia zopfii TaxID=1650 RepID=A0A8B4QCZ9_9BACL|nr:P1 family peptidase [Kurthia zopfii]PWI23666.1 aminopeptidase [Kurthia zopfii]TDR42649.1 D-aminopeptidase [Kurthia zopfii]GEK31096.1 aminopeptidase [Kurthia zopfii]STX10514.1 L-aminopeptidase/D-esterase [Kurthia zopfii]